MATLTETAAGVGAVSGARFPISVLILTRNEAANIEECLKTLEWADEVILIDSNSEDLTTGLARKERPDVRVFTHPFRDFGDQRNWALDHAQPRHDWVLFLDADERCTPACAAAIQAAVRNPGETVGFFLTCRNLFLGRWIKHCTFYPSWQLRLFKLGHVRYRREGHGQREVTEGPLEYLDEPYDHHGFSKGVAEWIERHNAYSSREVELIERLGSEPIRLADLCARDPVVRRRFLKHLAAKVGFRPLLRFVYAYILRGGFLDGRPGLMFCLLRVAHELHITVKLAERRAMSGKGRCNAGVGPPEPAQPLETRACGNEEAPPSRVRQPQRNPR
jgi:glycosyltransferase involved in cell wall biosynthesis